MVNVQLRNLIVVMVTHVTKLHRATWTHTQIVTVVTDEI